MAFLFLTSFCFSVVLFCPSYCAPVESIADTNWRHGLPSRDLISEVRGIFGNYADACRPFYQTRLNQKFVCVFCKGFDWSCFVTPLPSSTTSTTTPPSVSPSTAAITTVRSTVAVNTVATGTTQGVADD